MAKDLSFRKKYEVLIAKYSNAIAELDEKYMTTKDPNFALMRDHNIKLLTELKDYIVAQEKERGL